MGLTRLILNNWSHTKGLLPHLFYISLLSGKHLILIVYEQNIRIKKTYFVFCFLIKNFNLIKSLFKYLNMVYVKRS